MEKQIGNLTVSTTFAGIHTEQNVRRHFSKGGITLLPLRHLALVPHPQTVGGSGMREVYPKVAAEAAKERSDVFQCPPPAPNPLPPNLQPCDRVSRQGSECKNHSSASTQMPGGPRGAGMSWGEWDSSLAGDAVPVPKSFHEPHLGR